MVIFNTYRGREESERNTKQSNMDIFARTMESESEGRPQGCPSQISSLVQPVSVMVHETLEVRKRGS